MNIILLSGGSGKRLWPLSNNVRSKQFIKIFKKPNKNDYESMIQRVYKQIKLIDKDANITIATSKSQVSAIRNQIGANASISVEPCRRDTFPAIVLATAYLTDVKNLDKEEPIVVCPVDAYVEQSYFYALSELSSQVTKNEANLVLMGIKPTYPSEMYGYILPNTFEKVSFVSSFKEKPDLNAAKTYIRKGALWNGGVFAYKAKYLLNIAKQLIGFCSYDKLYATYNSLPSLSFDYAVVEKEKKIQVINYNGLWKDIGTWNTLTDVMEEAFIGNVKLCDDCSNVHVINTLDLPVLAMGLHDVIISASPDGILVSDKVQSINIKPYVDKIHQQAMFAEKSWGSFHVLDVESESLTIKVILNPGQSMNYHSHDRRNEVWSVISGKGRTIVDGMEQPIKAGDVITIQCGCRHTVIAETELKLIEIQIGKDISVEDKHKFELED